MFCTKNVSHVSVTADTNEGANIFEVMSDKFNVVGNRTNEKYA
jgi:hypothetical protein